MMNLEVLIVEDEYWRKAERVIEILCELGITTYCVKESVEEAMKAIHSTKFDLLITDLGLPKSPDAPLVPKEDGKNGFKMILKLAKKGIKIPTIIYSHNWLTKNDEKALQEEKYPFVGQVMDYVRIKEYIIYNFGTKESG